MSVFDGTKLGMTKAQAFIARRDNLAKEPLTLEEEIEARAYLEELRKLGRNPHGQLTIELKERMSPEEKAAADQEIADLLMRAQAELEARKQSED